MSKESLKYLDFIFVRMEEKIREKIAKEIEDSFNPPPVDETDYLIWSVIEKCASIARGQK